MSPCKLHGTTYRPHYMSHDKIVHVPMRPSTSGLTPCEISLGPTGLMSHRTWTIGYVFNSVPNRTPGFPRRTPRIPRDVRGKPTGLGTCSKGFGTSPRRNRTLLMGLRTFPMGPWVVPVPNAWDAMQDAWDHRS